MLAREVKLTLHGYSFRVLFPLKERQREISVLNSETISNQMKTNLTKTGAVGLITETN